MTTTFVLCFMFGQVAFTSAFTLFVNGSKTAAAVCFVLAVVLWSAIVDSPNRPLLLFGMAAIALSFAALHRLREVRGG